MKKLLVLAVLAAGLSAAGCAPTASLLSQLAVSTSSATPTQVKTIDEAVNADKLMAQSVDLYAQTGNTNVAVLKTLRTALTVVHTALLSAENANASGNSAATAAGLAAFSEALALFNGYETLKGVPTS